MCLSRFQVEKGNNNFLQKGNTAYERDQLHEFLLLKTKKYNYL